MGLLTAILGKIIALFTGSLYWKHLSLAYKIILLQVFIALCTEIAGHHIAINLHKYNLWLFNCYWLVDLFITSIAGYLLIQNKRIKQLVPLLLLAILIAWLINFDVDDIFIRFNPVLPVICLVHIIIFGTVILEASFKTGNVATMPNLWIGVSVVLFYACNFPLYSLFNYLLENQPTLMKQLFTITLTLNFVRYPLVACSIFLYARQAVQLSKNAAHVLK